MTDREARRREAERALRLQRSALGLGAVATVAWIGMLLARRQLERTLPPPGAAEGGELSVADVLAANPVAVLLFPPLLLLAALASLAGLGVGALAARGGRGGPAAVYGLVWSGAVLVAVVASVVL